MRSLGEDAVCIADLGLVEAARSFDPDRGFRFGTFASFRIEGRLKDELRERSPLSRAEQAAGVVPPSIASIDLAISEYGFDTPDDNPSPEEEAEAKDIKERVLQAMYSLAERDVTILRGIYFDELPLIAIGKQLGLGDSRVAQLRTRALQRLREALGFLGQEPIDGERRGDDDHAREDAAQEPA